VARGDGRGRQLGIPTANISSVSGLLPKDGVYAGMLWSGASTWPAVVNLGRKPTFGTLARTLEAHALGEPGDLYGQAVGLSFVARLRDERRFAGPQELVEQIHRDVSAARAVLRPVGL
jgi:riboflavin kinase/FMN adenylyltransferase